ncbi:MAG: TolC family protein [Terracidiphilus sp.]|jgi:outer membrane protein TolC
MQSFGTSVFEDKNETASVRPRKTGRGEAGKQLRAFAAVMLTLAAGVPSGFGQQPVLGAGQKAPEKAASELPATPAPALTHPLDLRTSARDFSKPSAKLLGSPINLFKPTSIPKASFVNSVRLTDLVKDGKIYLSLSDAIALALENNYDIAIARYDLDIADTDILRTRTGAAPLGAPSGLITNTLGGSASTLSAGGGPGGSTVGSGGAGSGSAGLSLTTGGAGPAPESLEPSVTANLNLDWASAPSPNFFTGGTTTADTYNFTYNQGFVSGSAFQFTWDNSRATNTNAFATFSPQFNANFKAEVTQHLLQGRGIWVNKRYMYQALNDRRIADSGFRQQILYTVNQVESIYWGLVQAYEDVQSKERAVEQSSKVANDNRKQLEIGTMAPLDVLNADQAVASDKQALISSQLALNYQQQIIKQAIARNLNDAALSAAAVIPTDRVSIEEIPEEKQPVEELVQEAFKQRPELEQAVLTLRNDEITLKGARNALLPQVDILAYLAGQGLAGTYNPNCQPLFEACPTGGTGGYGTALQSTFNNSSPDKGVGFNVTIPIGNKFAQSVQARSLMEYRQAELRLEQLYTQIRMQVVNQQFALTNDRAQVLASLAARDYNRQSLDAEEKKLHLGASTTALVLQQQRSLAAAEDSLIAAQASYAKDRASLYQILATTMQHYGINLTDAATGNVTSAPVVPGVMAAPAEKQPSTVPPATK